MIPEFELSPEQRQLRDDVRSFVAAELAPIPFHETEWEPEPDDRIPWEAVDAAGDAGLTSLTVPEEYGGRDASPLEVCIAVEELAAGDLGFAVVLDQNWKVLRMLDAILEGDVREEFFSKYVDDPRHLLASASTEPRNGSNNVLPYEEGRYDTTAVKEGDEWVIHGTKRYISNGADAKTLVVRAQTDPSVPHHDGGATAFLVPHDANGLSVSKVHEKFSQRTINNATLEFDGVRIPERYVLGDVGEGMRVVGEGLDGSHIEAGATALGAARAAFDAAFDYAQEREQAGSPILDHQSIGHDFADMATQLQAARALLWTAARAAEQQDDFDHQLSSMAKTFAADVAVDVSQRSLEKFGGAGIMLDSPVQKYFRDAVSFLHSDGTQTVHREKIIDELRDGR